MPFDTKNDRVSPRQAREKHRESTQKESGVFLLALSFEEEMAREGFAEHDAQATAQVGEPERELISGATGPGEWLGK